MIGVRHWALGIWREARGSRLGARTAFAALAVAGMVGCHTDMWRQPKQTPLSQSDFSGFNGQAARPLVEGTVPRGHLREDDAFYTGIKDGKWMNELPMAVTKELLQRGHERFDIYCSPCHGRLGDGKGMIAQRGLQLVRQPASYHTERLREMPVGFYYNVITNGSGVMFSYASRVEPQDRWAIVAYIRALQLSQNATAEDIATAEKLGIKMETVAPKEAPAAHAEGHTETVEGGAHE